MWNEKAHSNGGKVMAIRQREAALKRYYENPNVCRQCNSIIEVPDGHKITEIRAKVYCNSSCAAKWSNAHRKPKVRNNYAKDNKCACGKKITNAASKCQKCANRKVSAMGMVTKGEIFARSRGYQSARSAIRRHAERVYKNSNQPWVCKCGYDKHVEICHIKSVSSALPTDTLDVINAIDNLVVLCPNCHWELDNLVAGSEIASD